MIYGRTPLLQTRYALFILAALCAIAAAGCCFQSLPKTLAAPSPTPAATLVPPAPITPSIEKRVFDADVIVRARPPAVSGKVETIPSADECVAPTYRPALVFQFPVIEYLKGNGGDALSVEFPFAGSSGAHTYLTQEEAQSALTKQLANRNSTWDNRDAALFLKLGASQNNVNADGSVDTPPTYRFVRNTHSDYTIDKVNKPWLPVANASGQSDSEPVYILDSETIEEGSERLPTMSLAELRASIESVAAILKAGAGIEGYEECVQRWLISESPNDDEPYRPRVRSTSPISENEYDIVDDENGVQEFFYFSVYAIQRPLPGGAYRLVPHHYWAQWEPCNRNLPLDGWPRWEVAATAPNGASVVIERIEWAQNRVAIKISNPSAKLAGHHIDFIELDAGVSLRLDIDDAETTSTGYGQTLSWEVCRQPWHPGDMLMLRIAESDATDSATVKPVCVDDKDAGEAAPVPTITPTPTSTATHTPLPTETATPEPTATPTDTAGSGATTQQRRS